MIREQAIDVAVRAALRDLGIRPTKCDRVRYWIDLGHKAVSTISFPKRVRAHFVKVAPPSAPVGGRHGPMVYTVPEAAMILGIGRNQAYEAARSGVIPTIRIGNSYRVPRPALEKMLAGNI